MHRRNVLVAVAGGVMGVAGCSSPEVTERPTGEIDVAFRTAASRNYRLRLWLEDANGDVVEEFDSAIPAGVTPGPSFYAGGLSGGPYTVTIQTDADRTSFEWSIAECASLDVDVNVLADGTLDIVRACSPVSPEGPEGSPPGERTERS